MVGVEFASPGDVPFPVVLFVAGINERDAPLFETRIVEKLCRLVAINPLQSQFLQSHRQKLSGRRCRGICVCNVACRRHRAVDAGWKIVARERQTARRDQVGAKREDRTDDRHEKGFPEDLFDRGQAVRCYRLNWIVFHTTAKARRARR